MYTLYMYEDELVCAGMYVKQRGEHFAKAVQKEEEQNQFKLNYTIQTLTTTTKTIAIPRT